MGFLKSFLRRTVFYRIYKRLKAKTANFLYGYPSKGMLVVGATGTDGKTTTINLIHKILNDNLGETMLISTSNIKIGNEEIPNEGKMTSLDPIQLQKLLSLGKSRGCKYAVLEVSSHGIDQYRFDGIEFDLGVLTNISPEHLDYHKTMEEYANTKKKLFQSIIKNSKSKKMAVLPKDDKYGRMWSDEMAFDNIIDFSIISNGVLKGENIKENPDNTEFNVKYLAGEYSGYSNLLGKYNVYNILASLGVGILLGIKIENALNSIKEFQGLGGRMENIVNNGVYYYIDFAHTPQGLESVLDFLNNINDGGRIITLFGAPGNRDKFKRPEMAKVVSERSDIAIVTDDDPDTENRYSIINEVKKGLKGQEGKDYFIIPEREYAIKLLTDIVQEGDKVLLAGKGHEVIQLTNFGKRKWNDKETLKKYLDIN